MAALLDFNEAIRQVTPEVYYGYLEGVKLLEIGLESLEANLDRQVASETEEYNLAVNMDASVQADDTEQPVMFLSFDVDTSSDTGEKAVQVRATYRLKLSVAKVPPPEFFAIYHRVSAVPQVWPYLRELVQTLTWRMGVVLVTLPLFTDQLLNAASSPSPK